MRKALGAAVVVFLAALPAMAGLTAGSLVTQYSDVNGTHWFINGADVNLFEPTSNYSPSGPGTGLWDQNNMSPIDFPSVSPAYVPSPGSSGNYQIAEHTDLEGLLFDYSANSGDLKLWLVSSVGPNGYTYNSFPYHIGDVFLDTNGDSTYDYALLSFGAKPGTSASHSVNGDQIHGSWNNSNVRDAGQLADLGTNSILYGINGPNSYSGNSTIRGLVNPWAVNNPSLLGGDSLLYQEITGSAVNERDFAGGPGVDYSPSGTHSTFIYFWDVTLPETGLDKNAFDFHVVLQCGNDLIDGGTPVMPAPGALILGLFGAAGALIARRRMS